MRRAARLWKLVALAAAAAIAAPLAALGLLARSPAGKPSGPGSEPAARPRAFFEGLPKVANIAHRGASKQAPEHSLRALALALAQGADVLELDLRITADGQLVVAHDRTLERTTGLPIEIARTHWTVLQKLAGDQCPLPLDRVLEHFAGARLNLEMKDQRPEVPRALLSAIDRYGAADRVLVASFHTDMLEAFRGLSEGRVATSASMRQTLRYLARDWLHLAPVGNFDALQLPASGWLGSTRRGFVDRARDRGLAVHYWTIDDEAMMRRLVAIGADGLMTNRPARLTRVLSTSPANAGPPTNSQSAEPLPRSR